MPTSGVGRPRRTSTIGENQRENKDQCTRWPEIRDSNNSNQILTIFIFLCESQKFDWLRVESHVLVETLCPDFIRDSGHDELSQSGLQNTFNKPPTPFENINISPCCLMACLGVDLIQGFAGVSLHTLRHRSCRTWAGLHAGECVEDSSRALRPG